MRKFKFNPASDIGAFRDTTTSIPVNIDIMYYFFLKSIKEGII